MLFLVEFHSEDRGSGAIPVYAYLYHIWKDEHPCAQLFFRGPGFFLGPGGPKNGQVRGKSQSAGVLARTPMEIWHSSQGSSDWIFGPQNT